MSTSFSTTLARAHRHGQLLHLCMAVNPACVEAVLLVAKKKPDQVALYVDLTQDSLLHPAFLLDYAVHVAHSQNILTPIVARIHPSEQEVEQVLAKGIQALSFAWSGQAFSKRLELCSWAAKEANTVKAEVIGEIDSGITPLKLRTFAEESGIAALSVNFSQEELDQEMNFTFLKQLTKEVRVPIILPFHGITLRHHQRIRAAGVKAVTVDEYVRQSYTAGVRTALRSRFLYDPLKFEKKGILAVSSALEHLLSNT